MKFNKLLSWFLVVGLLFGMLAACASTEEPAPTEAVEEPAPTEAVEEPTEAPKEAAPEPTEEAKDEPAPAADALVDELVLAQTAETPTLDAQMNWSMIGRNIYYQLFGYLTRHNENMEVIPELAESWEWIDDLTLRWHLREGVTFHNGEPFNAEAMKYSIERIMNEETGAPWIVVLKFIDHLEIVDEYTVDVIAKYPTTAQLLEVGRMPMVPPKHVEEVGPEAFAENPVSAGPWKFVEWVKGDRVVLERNMDYWSGAPPVERLVFRVVPEMTTALAELQAGTLDIAKIAPESCETVNESDSANCVSARSIQNLQITFTNDTDDLAVRKAIAHAINVDAIIEHIMGGQAQRTQGPLSPLVWGTNPDFQGYEYDPELSKQLLAEAGYEPGDITMPLHWADGRFPKGREVAEAIAGDLEQVGIIVDLKPAEYGTWFDDHYEGKHTGMSLSASTATTGDPNQMFRDHLSETGIGYHQSEELDSYLIPVKEVVNPDERLPLVRAAEQYVFDEVLWIALYDIDLLYGVSDKVDWAPVPNDLKWVLAATPAGAAPKEAAPEPTEEAKDEPAPAADALVDELVLAQTAETPTLDAQMNWSMIGRNIYYQLFGYLTRHNENMEVIPELAESWEWVDDLTLRWHLREGVSFTNGEPFNAEAMKYSIERIMNEETGAPWIVVLKFIDHLEIVDEYTVDVIAKYPTTAQLLEVGRMPMVPPKYVEEVGPEAFAENPVSAGPWKFVEWVKGDRVVLERNMDYWQGPHPVERLVFRVVPEMTTALAELQAGTLDIAKIAPESCETVNESDQAACVSARSIQNLQITFTNDTDDLAVRKAIAHAINVDAIIEHIMGGQAQRTQGPLSPLVWGTNPDFQGYEYDPELSKQLLTEAGYEPGDITMPLHWADGRFPKGREVAEAIAGDLEQVGIIVDLKPAEYGTWFDDHYEGKHTGMSLSASTATTGDPNQMFRDHLSETGIGYHQSEELDSYLIPVKEVVNPDERLPLVRAAEQYVFDEVLWIALYDIDLLYGVSDKVDWAPVPNDLKWIYAAEPK